MDTTKPIEPLMSPLLDYCKQHGYGLLIASDTNAHHTDWGWSTNDRGKQLEIIIDNYGLTIHNQEKLPTYECKTGQSIIDVTLTSRFPQKIDNYTEYRETKS